MRRWMALVMLLGCDAGESADGSAAVDGEASGTGAGADPSVHDALPVSDIAPGGSAPDATLDSGALTADPDAGDGEAIVGPTDAAGLGDTGPRTRQPDVLPSDAGPIAPDLDTLPGGDAGAADRHSTSDVLSAAGALTPGDAAAGDATGAPDQETTKALLVGRWQMVAMADSGNPKEPVPPGAQFFAFRPDQTLASTCEAPGGAPWTVSADGGVVSVWFSPDSSVQWTILLLTAEELVFYEGGDIFYHERYEDCP